MVSLTTAHNQHNLLVPKLRLGTHFPKLRFESGSRMHYRIYNDESPKFTTEPAP